MDNLLIVLLVLAIICFLGKFSHSKGGGCNVKPKTNTKKPNIAPAPQGKSTD